MHGNALISDQGSFFATTECGIVAFDTEDVRLLVGQKPVRRGGRSNLGLGTGDACTAQEQPEHHVDQLVADQGQVFAHFCDERWRVGRGEDWRPLPEDRQSQSGWGCSASKVTAAAVLKGELWAGFRYRDDTNEPGLYQHTNSRWVRRAGELPRGADRISELRTAGGHLFAILNDDPYLYQSNENAWTRWSEGLPPRVSVSHLVAGDGYLYAATNKGVWRRAVPSR